MAAENGKLTSVIYHMETLLHNEVEKKNVLNGASRNGHKDIVKYLVEHCHAEVETKDNYRMTLLNNSSRNGHIEVVKYLVEHCHADVEIKDNDGITPLNNASRNGHIEVVKYLGKHCHTDVDTKDNNGKTPLNGVKISCHIDAVRFPAKRKTIVDDFVSLGFDMNYVETVLSRTELFKYL